MSRMTSAQRNTIRYLLRTAEYDTRTVTYMHRRLGVNDSWIGVSSEAWLDSLSVESASALIKQLQEEIA